MLLQWIVNFRAGGHRWRGVWQCVFLRSQNVRVRASLFRTFPEAGEHPSPRYVTHPAMQTRAGRCRLGFRVGEGEIVHTEVWRDRLCNCRFCSYDFRQI